MSSCHLVTPSRADRLVLAPRGLIVPPNVLKLEGALGLKTSRDNLEWVAAGLPGSLSGFEIEGERDASGGSSRSTFSLQYSFTGNAFSDVAPAISVGMRDALNQGREGRAIFAAATKTIKLSLQQERLVRDLQVDAGYGTSRMGGAYIGFQGRFTLGFTASAEYLARRLNASVAFPVGKLVNLKAYSLNGEVFYGASVTISR